MNVRLVRITVLAAGITTLLLAQRHAGFVLLLLAVPLVPWFLYSAFVITTQPARRVVQGLKVTIWLMSVLTVVCIHYYYHVSTRHDAQDIANAIQKYSNEHGICPSSLEAIGMTNAQLRGKLGYSAYVCEAGHPTLFYGSTYVPFEQDRYNFERKEWIHFFD